MFVESESSKCGYVVHGGLHKKTYRLGTYTEREKERKREREREREMLIIDTCIFIMVKAA